MKKITLILAALTLGSVLFAANAANDLEFNLKFSRERAEGGNVFVWPFASPSANTLSVMANTPSYVGEVVTLQYKAKDGTVYEFKACGKNGLLKNSKAGFMILSGPGSYIEFPAIPGKTLKEVEIVAGQAHSPAGTLDIQDAGGNSVSEQGAQGGFEAHDEIEWDLQKAEAGKAYRLVNLKANHISFVELKLEYK